jgi:ectoine hydroxylase-related dioxygenase (phytanoyl-CoA dioxygenase family)
MFENANTWTKQGDIGEARAIYEYTKMGYTVARTIFDSAKYDLIVDREGELKKVQVKTGSQVNRQGNPKIGLRTTGHNKTGYTRKSPKDGDFDELFILTEDDRCWVIPYDAIAHLTNTITLGKQYEKYRLP